MKRRTVVLERADLRPAALCLLAGGLVLPLLPGDPGFACPLRSATGVPCPLCGMTTSVEASVRLELAEAVAANPAGVVAVAAAIVLALRPTRVQLWSPLIYAGLASMWIFELFRFSIL